MSRPAPTVDQWPELDMPFPLRQNPHVEITRARTREWAIAMGMLPTDQARHWWDHVNLTALEAWCFPDVRPERLLLVDKWLSMGIMLDDQFDSTPLGRRLDATCRVMNDLITATTHPSGAPHPPRHPFSRAVTDLLAAFTQVMSPVWMQRHRYHLTLWWGGVVQAVAHRAHGHAPLTFRQRLAVRRLTVGMHAYGDLFELACDWEMPPACNALYEVQRIRRIVSDVTVYLNDLYSVERERAEGNDDNVLLAWESGGLTPEQARNRSAQQIEQMVREFITLRATLPELATAARLVTADQEGLERWAITCTLYLSGANHSQAIIPRYTDTTSHLAHDHRLDCALEASSTDPPPGRWDS
ncbi:terpene synthase family protein [Streptomyces sp. NPDC018045]|uniref:terpene synthase family protein n=1 Tax=Streptomyces sp. NPDC018045 TaxID=3365037 RepID=UPI0037BA7565